MYHQLLRQIIFGIIIYLFLYLTGVNAQTVQFRALAVLSRSDDHEKMMTAAKPFLEKLAKESHFDIDITDDTSKVNDTNLKNYAVFVMVQLAPFDMSYQQQDALQRFVEEGKGWVGIHAAGLTGKDFLAPDTRYWQWFETMLGNVVYSPHPAFQKGTVIIEDRQHPITRNLPAKMEIEDEWYEYNRSPRGEVHVLATADESTYKQVKPMGDHPIIWINEHFRRVVYIGIGHSPVLMRNPDYAILVRNAILWAASK